MRHPNPNLMTKLDTYRKALVKEFIKELKHISEVKAGRAAKKPDFSDEIINLGKSFGINALSNVGLPGMSLAANSLEIVVDWANEQRSKTKIEHLDAQYQETTKKRLEILLESVAWEACRRYEWFIGARLPDDDNKNIRTFAKIGAQRMRNYVAQQQLNLSEENLLMGLILGESGRYEDGWKNNRLKNKKLSSQKIQTAEGIYGRPAFKTADGQYWIAINKDSKTIKTKRKINDFINRYGYTKMQTWRNGLTRQIEPKYGFVLVPQQVIEKLNYQPAETIAQFAVSPELTNEISDNPPGLQTIGRDEMRSYAEYLNVVRNRPAELILSFNDFMRQRFPFLIKTFFYSDNKQDYDLTEFDFRQAKFNDCILIDCKFGGSLSGAEFIDACLIAADLSQVKQANAANFTGAMMGGVNAAHANLDNSNLAFTNLDHADLTNAHLQNVNDFGASMTAVKYRDSVPDAEAQDAIIASRVAATKRKKRERQINWLKDALNLGFPSDPSQLLNQLPNDKMANELRDLFEELRYQFTALGQALSFIEKQKITVSDYVNLYRAAVNMLSIEIRSEPDTVVRKINYQQLTENQVEAVQILHTIHLIQIFWGEPAISSHLLQLIHYGQVDIDAEINLNAYLTILANEALIESNDSMETVSLQRNVDQLVMMNAKSDDIIKLIMKIMVVLPTFKTQINDEKLLTIVSKINTYVVALRPLLTKEQALLYANKIDELNEFYRFHFYHASVAVSLLKSSYEIHRQYEGDGEQTIQVLNNLGKAYKELGNKVKAKDCFDLALKIQPQPEANTSHRIARLIMAVRGLWGTNDQDAQAKRPSQDQISNKF